jgi:CRISPR-associated endonuclease/helicase Cas3
MARYRRPGFRHELASALALLSLGRSDLVAYLVAAHHGKVRLSIRALPIERRPSDGRRYARGIWDGDVLPAAAPGGGVQAPSTVLDPSLMELGEREVSGPSWLARTLALRDDAALGPFRLGLLEALLRVADWRGSAPPPVAPGVEVVR